MADQTAPAAPPAPLLPPLLLSARGVARMLSIGKTKLYALHATGRCPLPVRLGRAVRWNRRELEEWTAAGCPPRERWELLRGTRP